MNLRSYDSMHWFCRAIDGSWLHIILLLQLAAGGRFSQHSVYNEGVDHQLVGGLHVAQIHPMLVNAILAFTVAVLYVVS